MADEYQQNVLRERMMSAHIEQMNKIEAAELRLMRQISEAQELENVMKRWQARNRENLQKLTSQ